MNALERLIGNLARLPGLGKKSASRIAYHLLRVDESLTRALSEDLGQLHLTIRNCGVCGTFCPEAAIVQAEGHVVIDPARCVGCGECLVVCKHGAIKMKWDEDSLRLQEKMAEYAFRVSEHFEGKAVFVSFLIQVTKDCDCMAKNQKPIAEDIGILASLDPVAIDQAAADLLVARRGGQDPLRAGHDIDWSGQLAHGEKIGLGTRKYRLVEIA